MYVSLLIVNRFSIVSVLRLTLQEFAHNFKLPRAEHLSFADDPAVERINLEPEHVRAYRLRKAEGERAPCYVVGNLDQAPITSTLQY